MPQARTVSVPGAAHNVASTAPHQVADVVRALLDERDHDRLAPLKNG
ncbi:hypothetical protein [Micromonospora sp. NPDC047134]